MNRILILGILFITNFLYSQEWKTFYTNDRDIENFAVAKYADEFSIYDGNKIKIINSTEVKSFYKRDCKLVFDDGTDYKYTLHLNKVKSLLYNGSVLHVATKDSVIATFEDQSYLASFPFIYVYDSEIYQDEYVSSINLAGKYNIVCEFDVEDATYDPYGECDYDNGIFPQDIRDISTGEIASVIDADNSAILNIVQGLCEVKINTFDFDKLPFKKFIEVQGVFDVIYGSGQDRRKYNLWAITDSGLAMYKSNIHYGDFENWTEDNWISYSTQNSWLLSNDLFGLQKIYSKYSIGKNLVVFSNSPYPTMYYFNPKGEIICIYNYTNSPILKNKNITAVSQDNEYGVYISQGNKIFKLTLDYDMNCYPLSISNDYMDIHQTEIIPNPASNYFVINSDDDIKNCSLYSIQGVKITDFKGNTFRDASSLKNGIYLLYINFENGDKSIKKIIIN